MTEADCSCRGSTQQDPIVVGKPAEFMLANISESFGLERSQICMVGDRLDTDILFGQNGGLSTCLVLSGKLSTILSISKMPFIINDTQDCC